MSIPQQNLHQMLSNATGQDRITLLIDYAKETNFYPFEQAKACLDEAISLATKQALHRLLAKAYLAKCQLHREDSNYKTSITLCKKALDIGKKIDDQEIIIEAMTLLGVSHIMYYKEPERQKGYTYLKESLTLAQKHQFSLLTYKIYGYLGFCYQYTNKMGLAGEYHLKALEGYKKHNFLFGIASTYHNLAYTMRRNKEKAMEYAKLSLEVNLQLNNKTWLLRNYNLLSELYRNFNEHHKALDYAQKAVVIAKEVGTPKGILQSTLFLADLYYRLSFHVDIPTRLTYLQKASNWVQEGKTYFMDTTEFFFRFIAIQLELLIAFQNEDFDLALQKLKEAEQFNQKNPLPKHKKFVEEYFYLCYRAKQDYQKALLHHENYLQLLTEINETDTNKKLDELQVQYETKEKEKENKRLQELEVLKTRFFSQITHELRTPLTLIKGPVRQIIQSNNLHKSRLQAEIIERNADRLLLLVNQLLDVNKLEAGKMKLKESQGSLPEFIEAIVEAFRDLSNSKQINLVFQSELEKLFVLFDKHKMEKILYNLLSNACKFTPPKGQIICSFSLGKPSMAGTQAIRIQVADTGRGIGTNHLPHIFDRFYQADNSLSRTAEGTGIGLSLVKELVELMGGTISVHSTLGEGTNFEINLTLQVVTEKESIKAHEISFTIPKQAQITQPKKSPNTKTKQGKKPSLLLVEDNKDLHTYIRSLFEKDYNIIPAYNGKQGLELAQKHTPNIILSDVMMPIMNGYEMCTIIKNTESTSHIPIVLLTAKAALNSRIEGFEQGADAYIAKPFSAEELKLQLRNLLTTQSNLQKKLQQFILHPSQEREVVDKETQFLNKVIQIIETYLADEELNVEDLNVNTLSKALFMSSSQVYRKILALTNTTVTAFIRNIRLARAKEMLERKEGNVTDIALAIGWSPSYFSRAFTKQYGFSPKKLLL